MSLLARTFARFSGATRVALALMLAVFVLAPSFDFECAAEGLSISSASAHAAVQASELVAKASPSQSTGADRQTCPHGHCHHGVIADLRDAPVATLGAVEHAAHLRWASTAATSPSPDRLDRPPRA